MDETGILDRAEVVEDLSELFPGESPDDGANCLVDDPETDCRGVGEFEHEAWMNLIHAVRAYRADPERETGYFSAGCGHTYEMRWLRDDGLSDRIRDALPY